MSEDTALTVRAGLLVRIMRALRLVEVRDDGSTSFDAGAAWASNQPAGRTFPAITSMSASAAFPWVQACSSVISSSLAGLPLKVIKGRGADAEVLESHPVLDLLDRPSSRTPGTLFRAQLAVDLVLSGDCFFLIATAGTEPAALIRLHPENVRIIGESDTQISGYVFTTSGAETTYTPDQVVHIRLPSWATGPKSLYGTGAIEALNDDLKTDQRSAELAADTAKTGRPSALISPAHEGDMWSDAQVKAIRRAWESQLKGTSGALILGSGGVSVDMLSHSPRDMEFSKVRELAREAVLGAMQVPPTIVSIPTANFATARAQQRNFWVSLQARSSLLDHGFTTLARLFPDSEDVRVVHDFSAVEALQESRSERLQRVQQWWMMGVSLAEAATLEGFEEVSQADIEEAPPTEDEERSTGAIARWLKPEDGPKLVQKATGGEVWRDFITKQHEPTERRMALLMTRFLREYGKDVAKRAGEELKGMGQDGIVTRASLSARLLDKILDAGTMGKEVLRIFRPVMRDAIDLAMQQVAAEMPVSLTFAATVTDDLAREQIGRHITNVGPSTRRAVRATLIKAIDEGATLGQMQQALQGSYAFSPARALTIARTETTVALSGGRQKAYEVAQDVGVELQKEWLTAGDEVVRDAHRELGGMGPIDIDQNFEIDGAAAPEPGLFGVAGLDINCRCVSTPVVKGRS